MLLFLSWLDGPQLLRSIDTSSHASLLSAFLTHIQLAYGIHDEDEDVDHPLPSGFSTSTSPSSLVSAMPRWLESVVVGMRRRRLQSEEAAERGQREMDPLSSSSSTTSRFGSPLSSSSLVIVARHAKFDHEFVVDDLSLGELSDGDQIRLVPSHVFVQQIANAWNGGSSIPRSEDGRHPFKSPPDGVLALESSSHVVEEEEEDMDADYDEENRPNGRSEEVLDDSHGRESSRKPLAFSSRTIPRLLLDDIANEKNTSDHFLDAADIVERLPSHTRASSLGLDTLMLASSVSPRTPPRNSASVYKNALMSVGIPNLSKGFNSPTSSPRLSSSSIQRNNPVHAHFEKLGSLPVQDKLIMTLAASDYILVTGFIDGTIRVWSLRRFQPLHSIRGHAGPVLALCISIADGIIVSSGRDNRIKIWKKSSFECLATLPQTSHALSIRIDDGRLFAGFDDGSIRVWSLSSFECIRTVKKCHSSSIFQMSVLQSQLWTCGRDHDVKIFDLDSLDCLETLHPPHFDGVTGVTFDAQHAYSVSRDGFLRQWDLNSLENVASTKGHSDWIVGTDRHQSGEIITFSKDGTMSAWSSNLECVALSKTPHGGKSIVCYTLHSDVIFTAGGDRRIRMWRLSPVGSSHCDGGF